MGKKNIVCNRYFRDKAKFADLFNGVYFRGENVIKADELTEISGIYDEHEGEKEELNERGEPIERIRDVQMSSGSGTVFRLLAIENQDLVHYAMPFRCMQYDTMEYGRQLKEIRRRNEVSNDYESAAERVGGIKKADRLTPVYTLCLYHGSDEWDGPRSLKDMMDFGDDEDEMSRYFADYPMHLFCVNEQDDFSVFQTEIRSVFEIMSLRTDLKRLRQVTIGSEKYRDMDLDSLEMLSVMLDAPWMWKRRHEFMSSEKEEKVNMCKALQEWSEEERSIGRAEGRAEGGLMMLLGLLKKGIITFEDAVRESGLPEDAFRVKFEELNKG